MNKHGLVDIAQEFARLKFMLMKNPMSLKDISELMNVPKRRLYDVVNVLQSMNMVERVGKTTIRWVPTSLDAQEVEVLQGEVNALAKQEKDIDSLLKHLKEYIELEKGDPENQPYSYVKKSEISEIFPVHNKQYGFRSSANNFKNIQCHTLPNSLHVVKTDSGRDNELLIYALNAENSNHWDYVHMKEELTEEEEEYIEDMYDPMIAANEETVIEIMTSGVKEEDPISYDLENENINLQNTPDSYHASLSPPYFDFAQPTDDYFSFKDQDTSLNSPSSQFVNSNDNNNNQLINLNDYFTFY